MQPDPQAPMDLTDKINIAIILTLCLLGLWQLTDMCIAAIEALR